MKAEIRERKMADVAAEVKNWYCSKILPKDVVSMSISAESSDKSLADESDANLSSSTLPKIGAAVSGQSSVKLEAKRSVFCGGRRMDALLLALKDDEQSGRFFQKYLETLENQQWRNALDAWKDLQKFHSLFYQATFDNYYTNITAKVIYSRYVVDGAPQSIDCSRQIRETVASGLGSPYEGLFDEVEKFVLITLYTPWSMAISYDMASFEKIVTSMERRQMSVKSKHAKVLRREGLISEKQLEDDKTQYNSEIMRRVPEKFRQIGLSRVMNNQAMLQGFMRFMMDNYADLDLDLWLDVEQLRQMDGSDAVKSDKLEQMRAKYFTHKYLFGPSSPADDEGQMKIIEKAGGTINPTREGLEAGLLESQKYVEQRLNSKWLPLFLATKEFDKMTGVKGHLSSVVEVIQMRQAYKRQGIEKKVQNRLTSLSKQLRLFRKALKNPFTFSRFQDYLSELGDNNENNLVFWQEVEKYKHFVELNDLQSANQIAKTLITLYIRSGLPPHIHVDITEDLANDIATAPDLKLPVVLNKAQMLIFRGLYRHWNQFREQRKLIQEEELFTKRQKTRQKASTRGPQADIYEFKQKGPTAGVERPHVDRTGKQWTWPDIYYLRMFDTEKLLNATSASDFLNYLNSR